ncbi:fungal-specific transcription factor domain-containing protein [Amylocarpus encephaloides]|uniref:Fungal-specific transcription factor domain-containing protein n=1 Tax=Amylocarpus encephaloides TaxID=45428 RepID=A0A9P7YTD7_9HELO|nr:fungal-specific transcription factor domain-containing protein [Amylocarpus encephaloides]
MAAPSGGASTAVPPAPKQIRFVNNEGQPPAKRRRINAACRTCRKRKTRCDGKRPLCSTCTENGHTCLGYEAIGEGTNKKERKESETTRDEQAEEEVEERKVSYVGQLVDASHSFARNKLGRRHNASKSSISPDSTPNLRRESSSEIDPGKSKDFGINYRESAVYSDDGPSPVELSPPLNTESHRVPFFRYFGPTAIVPGFKQMVVSVREHRRSTGAGSAVAMSPSGSASYGSVYGDAASLSGTEPRASVEMPIYHREDPLPVNRLIIHLVETFFAHLGCNYPFLQQVSFMRRVEEKSVDAILVDAACSLSSRFSDHPLIVGSHHPSYPRSDYGNIFAQRAKAALVDHFPCPSVAATQACLLLAYEGFGANQDSALWMYLGCAIRMAVDLGLQKLDGIKHQGQKDPEIHRMGIDSGPSDTQPIISDEERQQVEQERIDTLWSVFILDRVISSGTGRPVTLKDEDFELTFPAVTPSKSTSEKDWPNPFPALIRIIHLYGRVSDLLNNIRNVQDVTPKKIEGLGGMEKDLTQLYQRLDQRLTFNAANFQHYVKSGEGTNFILVHFWFHTLIMLLHQPQLMHSFEGQILQLLPNSRELSMSSAKTVADIIAFAELIDPRSFIGNPFTSQPMYIAACAFLMESAAHTSSPPSRDGSPPRQSARGNPTKDSTSSKSSSIKAKNSQKHSLLASAANQNYQRCYKALQQLEKYWGGTRYILVALDQKAKGIWDPETYTEQEYESTKPRHDMIPSWRRKLSMAAPSPSRFRDLLSPRLEIGPGSPSIDPSHAIGWSLTGTTNSPSSNLTFMYQNTNGEQPPPQPPPLPQHLIGNMIYDPIRGSLPEITPSPSTTAYPSRTSCATGRHPMAPPAPKYPPANSESASTTDAEMLLGLQNSSFAHMPGSQNSYDLSQGISSPGNFRQDGMNPFDLSQNGPYVFPNSYMDGINDMMMESQDIDMSTMGGDMMPWLEYLPQDVLNFFDNGNSNAPIPSGSSLNGSVDMNNKMPPSNGT